MYEKSRVTLHNAVTRTEIPIRKIDACDGVDAATCAFIYIINSVIICTISL